MTDSPTGQKRLKAGLPKNWSIAHKTGTAGDVLGIGPATNDVGIISSPNGQRVAVAVFIADSKAPLEKREKVMSQYGSDKIIYERDHLCRDAKFRVSTRPNFHQ